MPFCGCTIFSIYYSSNSCLLLFLPSLNFVRTANTFGQSFLFVSTVITCSFNCHFYSKCLFYVRIFFCRMVLFVGNIISYYSNLFIFSEQSNYFVKLPLHFVQTVIYFVKTVLFVQTDILFELSYYINIIFIQLLQFLAFTILHNVSIAILFCSFANLFSSNCYITVIYCSLQYFVLTVITFCSNSIIFCSICHLFCFNCYFTTIILLSWN